jgi:hypothetical protein
MEWGYENEDMEMGIWKLGYGNKDMETRICDFRGIPFNFC